MLVGILSLAVSVIGIFVAVYLYKKSKKKPSVRELNRKLKKKTIRGEEDGIVIYKACPECGAKQLDTWEETFNDLHMVETKERHELVSGPYKVVFFECKSCGWKNYE